MKQITVITAAGVEHRYTDEEVKAAGGRSALLQTLPAPRSVRYESDPEAQAAEALARTEAQKAGAVAWRPGAGLWHSLEPRRKRADWALIAIVAIIAALVVIVGVTMVYEGAEAALENQCAAAGYPSSKVTWTFDRYCIKRVDQTDVVVPLGEVEEEIGR
jgi:hypothetical protein